MPTDTSNAALLTIGRLSHLAEIPADTVRFYERSGLLEADQRTGSGYRKFSRNAVARILFIRRARETGYTIDQIRKILDLYDHGGSKDSVAEFTKVMIAEVDEKMRSLSKWRELFADIAEYLENSDADTIDSDTVDLLMRRQCDKFGH